MNLGRRAQMRVCAEKDRWEGPGIHVAGKWKEGYQDGNTSRGGAGKEKGNEKKKNNNSKICLEMP